MGWKLTSLGGPWRRGGEPGSLAGLLETRPGSAASLLCQQEPGPSLRSPCPQIHLQKMARDRVRLVPRGSPRGSLCPWLSQIILSSLPACLATNTLLSACCVPETGQNPFSCVKGVLTHLILTSAVRERLFWWGRGLTFFLKKNFQRCFKSSF